MQNFLGLGGGTSPPRSSPAPALRALACVVPRLSHDHPPLLRTNLRHWVTLIVPQPGPRVRRTLSLSMRLSTGSSRSRWTRWRRSRLQGYPGSGGAVAGTVGERAGGAGACSRGEGAEPEGVSRSISLITFVSTTHLTTSSNLGELAIVSRFKTIDFVLEG